MDYDGGFIIHKTVDWYSLNDGKNNPVLVCALLMLPATTALSTRTTRTSTKGNSSLSSRMVKC